MLLASTLLCTVPLEYRMPMYDILKFLWSSPAYDSSIKRLADEVGIYSSWMLHVKRGGTYVDDPFVLLGRGRWGLYGDHIISEVY